MAGSDTLDLGMRAPDLVLETRVSGRSRTRPVPLREGDGRWTVLVFEPEPDAARLREIEALRTNFVAEDAVLVVVAPPGVGTCSEFESAATRLQAALDEDGGLAAAFGVTGPATFVLDSNGTVFDAHHGPGGEYVALALLQALRIGSPSLRLVHAARDVHHACTV